MADDRVRVRITPEYPRLVISDDGKIQGPSGRWLKPGMETGGYLLVGAHRPDGSYRSTSVHVVVCTAFHGPKPTPDHEVAHRNGIKTDNRAENLRWATRSENHQDKTDHGTQLRGSKHNMVKLNEDQVREIRGLFGHVSESKIALRYGVSRGAVSDIRRGRNWGWLV